MSKRRRKPRGVYTITKGKVDCAFPYDTYWLRGTTLLGRRIREQDTSRAVLEGRKQALEIEDANAPDERPVNSHLTPEQVREAESAFQRLKGKSLSLAVDHFVRTYREPTTTLTLPEVLALFLADKKDDVAPNVLANYRGNVGLLVAQHPSKKPHEITTQHIVDFLNSRRCSTKGARARWVTEHGVKVAAPIGPVRWNHLRTDLHAFFEWCRLAPRKWVPENPVHDVRKKKVKYRLPAIIHTRTCIDLLTYLVSYKDGILVPYCCYALFAGIRPSARHGEIWKFSRHPNRASFIRREDKIIQIDTEVAKTGRPRQIVIQPNMAKWMDAYPISKYPLCPTNLEAMMAEVRKKFDLKPDVLRHTFASMHVGKFKSIGDCAIQSGNSEAIVKRNYLNQVPEAEAALFWEITPATVRENTVARETIDICLTKIEKISESGETEVSAKTIMPLVYEQQIGRGMRPTGKRGKKRPAPEYVPVDLFDYDKALEKMLEEQAKRPLEPEDSKATAHPAT